MASNDAALVLRKLSQFIVGAGTAEGTAGGAPTLGQRVTGGFSSISPAFRQEERLRLEADQIRELQKGTDIRQQEADIFSRRTDIDQQQLDILRDEEKRLNKIVSLDEMVKNFGPKTKQQITDFVTNSGRFNQQAGGLRAEDAQNLLTEVNTNDILKIQFLGSLIEDSNDRIRILNRDFDAEVKKVASKLDGVSEDDVRKNPASFADIHLSNAITELASEINKRQPFLDELAQTTGAGTQAPQLTGAAKNELIAGRNLEARAAVDRANLAKGKVATLGATQVNLGKTTTRKLEEEIIESDSKIEAFDEIERLFNPEFLTYKGQVSAALERFAEKAGFSTSTEFLAERTIWKQQAMTAFLAWRKWVTGVAGGEKEMKEIAKSFPDPQRNSPTEFKANLEQARRWTTKLRNRLIIFRSLGIESPTGEQLSQFPLEDIPEILPPQGTPTEARAGGIKTADEFIRKHGGT